MTGFSALLFACLLAGSATAAEAQKPQKPLRVGFLVAIQPAAVSARLDAFRQALRGLGYTEGQNLFIETRSAEGKLDQLPALATELVKLNVDVILSGGPMATGPALKATKSIPIVMAQDSDPVGNGFVTSLARPGGNVTGLSNFSPEISGKRLEILKEIVPKLSRVTVLGSSAEPGNQWALNETERAAAVVGAKLQVVDVKLGSEIDGALKTAAKFHADGMLVLAAAVFNSHRAQLIDLAAINRLPTIYPQGEFTDAGGLLYYGASVTDLFRRAAIIVDKIAKGAKPAELPVESPSKFEFVVNLKAAKQIVLTMPPNVLARADRVIR